MKIFITGTAGFIGFSLAKFLLENGHNVHGYDGITNYYDIKLKQNRNKILTKYKKFSSTKGMLENKDLLKKTLNKFKPEIIIHLAAQAGVRYSIEQPRSYLSSNIMGTFNIIELAHKIKVKHLLIASSSSVYGANKKIPYRENDNVQSQLSVYASTKLATESLAHSYSNIWKLPTTVLRFFTVYGPWGRPDMAYYIFADKIYKGEPISVFNHGKMERDFTYIDDIISGTRSAIDKNYPCELFNLGNNNSEDLMEMVGLIESEIGKKAEIQFEGMQLGDIRSTFADIEHSKQKLNYIPTTKIVEGIPKFIDWFKKYNK